MAKYLVIVESPAKAKTIEKFLGRNYKVKASVGHVRDLPKSKMGVDVDNDFEPRYITIRGKGEVLKELKKLAKKAEKVFLATDPDREGEAIAWHLATYLKIDPDSDCRVTFQEITKTAIKEAMKHPRSIDQDLVDAQQARRILDRLVGYSISPILWRKIMKGLSAGRVQSVATKLVCDREREIDAFVEEEYWKLAVSVKKTEKDLTPFDIEYAGKGKKKETLPDKNTVTAIEEELLKHPYIVNSVDKKTKYRKPFAPFTTSSLQQEASNRFGFSTKKTMMVAQQLYEGIAIKGEGTTGLITYMRTDSTRVSDEAKSSAHSLIGERYGKEYLNEKGQKKKAVKGSQDAHEAIRPTYVHLDPEKINESLKKDQYRLYKLIWDRFVASEMAAASYEAIAVDVANGEHHLKANGTRALFDGYLKVYRYQNFTDTVLPELVEGEELKKIRFKPSQHFTKPPARYSEASLVKEMEDKGIGRPSTYAPTISTILSRGYVEREKKSLKPTELGQLTNDIMENHFDTIVDVDFTATMESEFDRVEEGEHAWKEVIRSFYENFEKLLEKADEAIEKVDMTEKTDKICPKCGAEMVIRHGRFGKFYACSQYPDCDHTEPFLIEIGVPCPSCEDGQVVERKTKKYKTFYGCSNYPDCRFVSWKKPVGRPCPKCSEPLVEHRTRKGASIKCMNKKCDYTEPLND